MNPVKTKSDFYKRWRANEFGNRLRVWMSLEELKASDYRGKIGIRYIEPGSPYMKYDIHFDDVPFYAEHFILKGADPSKMTFGEAAPDQHILFQGELYRTTESLYMFYSLDKSQMRTALAKAPQHAEGVKAHMLLRHFCNDSSYDDIQYLLDTYEDHIIELSCYGICLGNMKHRNTLIWEIRQY